MTEAEAQAILHTLFEGDNSTPSSTDAEYLSRRNLLNTAILIWEREDKWRELYATLAAADGVDTATAVGDSSYNMPTNFRSMVGYVRIGTTDYPYKDVNELQFVTATDTTEKYYYITGNVSSTFDLNIHPTPTAVETITYTYYKSATQLTSTSSVFEMSDPLFAVYFALAHLKANAGEPLDLSMAQSLLDKMKEANIEPPYYQANKILVSGSNKWGS